MITSQPVEQELDQYRRELTGYCYRMLGSGFEAEDAVQETMVRAWKSIDRLTAREALRSWMYRIATNVCLDMLDGAQRRARPMDFGPSSTTEAVVASGLPAGLAETTWIQPIADARTLPESGDPAELAAARETVRLAFVAALQHLPPRQRAVLILREVLRWQASEVAELLGTTVASVNSALQRARATIDAMDLDAADGSTAIGADQQELLSRYVDAFERYDVAALVALLHEDASFSMPPHPLWLVGPDQVAQWLLGPGIGCRGSKVLTTRANGGFAYGAYKPTGDGRHLPFALAVVEVRGDRISGIHNYLYPELFASFGFPDELRDE
ncbi:MAG TPA: sigma-70 family RNA polymerase sigma factor [Baekduia sp.]|jgi:RNA polymerase sigma-70 factor (ECF subfamily)